MAPLHPAAQQRPGFTGDDQQGEESPEISSNERLGWEEAIKTMGTSLLSVRRSAPLPVTSVVGGWQHAMGLAWALADNTHNQHQRA